MDKIGRMEVEAAVRAAANLALWREGDIEPDGLEEATKETMLLGELVDWAEDQLRALAEK